MFTGIVEELATVHAVREQNGGLDISIKSPFASGLSKGSSIALNGCCVTVVSLDSDSFSAHLMPETLHRTNLADVRSGDRINIERTMPNDGRFEGHIVQGHIDGVGTITEVASLPDGSADMRVAVPSLLSCYIVEKGSIALDGVSLTVVETDRDSFRVALIPHTLAITTLGFKQIDDSVNIEVDILAKYVERLIQKQGEA